MDANIKDNNLKYLDFEGLKKYDSNIKKYISIENLMLEGDIKTLNSNIEKEKERAISVEENLKDKINILNTSIIEHSGEYNLLNSNLSEHRNNYSNPHNVTIDQIGAVSYGDHLKLEQRIVTVEADNLTQKDKLETIDSNIININNSLIDLNTSINNKISYNGANQVISGGLISNGDLRITGNLIVDGTTTTKDTETSLIKDNFIIINSDGESLGTQLSGLSIRLDPINAYGIAYDVKNDSVSLGQGIINSNGSFSFNLNESKPILTRDTSDNIQHGHLLIWDAIRKIAIDGGAYDLETLKQTFTNWGAHNALVKEVRDNSNAIDNLKIIDNELNSSISRIENKHTNDLVTINSIIDANKQEFSTNLTSEILRAKLAEEEINTKINNLNFETNLGQNYTLKSIKQENGLLSIEPQLIQIDIDQVSDLETTLDNIKVNLESKINSNSLTLKEEFTIADNELRDSINNNQDRLLKLESTVTTCEALDESVQSIIANLDESNYNSLWILSFEPIIDEYTNEIISYKPKFVNLDDGEL